MEYPFIIDGESRGQLNVRQEGLFTVLELWAEKLECAGLTRVSVYGDGQEAYLGIAEPRNGGLYLRRRFSRREMETLPPEIEYAGIAGTAQAPAPSPAPSSPSDSREEDGLLWYRKSDGTLSAFDGEYNLIAIPAKLRQIPKGAVLRLIEGREYMLFRY